MRIVYLIICAFLGMLSISKAQLVPLFREPHEVLQNQSTFEHLNIIVNTDGSVTSNKGELLFKPDLKEDRYILEIWNKRLLVITELVEGSEIYSMVYQMPKNKLYIVDLFNGFKKYRATLAGCVVADINLESLQITCKEGEGSLTTFEIDVLD